MKKISILALLFLSIPAGIVHADKNENHCGELNVSIANFTNSACTLISSNLKHGYYKYTSSVPTFIPAGTTASPIFLEQSLIGPELELTYACGEDKMIRFNSQQNLCFMASGDVNALVSLSRNAVVDYQIIRGSWLWSQHGTISWRLQ